MGIRSSFSKALVNGWSSFNQEMAVGLAEHQIKAQMQEKQRRARHIDSLITGDYQARSTSRITCS